MTSDPQTRFSILILALCLTVLACIWTAGLWPFHAPENEVSWLRSEDGVRFEKHAAIVSAATFKANTQAERDGVSLEVWLEPTEIKGAILAFDSSPDLRLPFILRQSGRELTLQRYVVDSQQRVSHPLFRVERAFAKGKRSFLTITSNKDGVRCYVNGILTKESSDPGITNQELSGLLVVGNSTWDDRWLGVLAGLAIYDRQLDSSEVKAHYDLWTSGQGTSLAGDKSLAALYTFGERQGNSVRNLVDPATSLIIPAKCFVIHKGFLRSVTNDFRNMGDASNRWSMLRSALINVFGFVPVGFVLFAFFTSVKPIRHPVLVVVILGFLVSLSVEVLQWFLPNRDSGMNDLFTNTGGTALGVLVYRWPTVGRLWRKLNLAIAPAEAHPTRHFGAGLPGNGEDGPDGERNDLPETTRNFDVADAS